MSFLTTVGNEKPASPLFNFKNGFFRCWHKNISDRPPIKEIIDFFKAKFHQKLVSPSLSRFPAPSPTKSQNKKIITHKILDTQAFPRHALFEGINSTVSFVLKLVQVDEFFCKSKDKLSDYDTGDTKREEM